MLNVVPGFGATGPERRSPRHMDVDMIAFHGVGCGGQAADAVFGAVQPEARFSLELGGKSPQIVFADCPDFNAAALSAAWDVFFNQGEVCTAASRLLVQEDIADAFVDKLLKIAKRIVPGDPLNPSTTFGSMV